MKRLLSLVVVGCLVTISAGADRPAKEFPLWTGKAPGAIGDKETDIPTLTPYWPEPSKATGSAIVVAPGGGYNVLAPHEGETYAKWLADHGIAAFVLKYRLVKNGYTVPIILHDAARSIRVVRANAKEWGLDPARIGIIGSSAGGHLSATLATTADGYDAKNANMTDRVDSKSSRPDVVILCYAFIMFDRDDGKGRQERFIGSKPTAEQIKQLSPALNVSKTSPPCFIWQTVEDPGVVAENALVLADAYRKAGAPFDLHLYQKGKHGIGLGVKEYDPAKLHPWARDCMFWLGEQGFLAK
jgi:acetyl esterase/lipase